MQLGVGVLCKTPIKLEFRENRLTESCNLFKAVNEFFKQFGVNFNVENFHIISLSICGLPTCVGCLHLWVAYICGMPTSVVCLHLCVACICGLPASVCCLHLWVAYICGLPTNSYG